MPSRVSCRPRPAGENGFPILNSERERHQSPLWAEKEPVGEIRLAKGSPTDGISESGGLREARKGQQYALNHSHPLSIRSWGRLNLEHKL